MNTDATRITFLGHACVLLQVEQDGRVVRILVDPGNLTPALDDIGSLDAILVTHDHPDHLDSSQLTRLGASGPLTIYGPGAIASRLPVSDATIISVEPGAFEVAGVEVTAVRSIHETLYPGVPLPENFGFRIGGVFAPGDALTAPDGDIEVLLAPVAGPWMKLSEGIDFVRRVAPEVVIPIHDSGLAASHRELHRSLLRAFAPEVTVVRVLDPGESITI